MKRIGLVCVMFSALELIWLGSLSWAANTNADYAAQPPFVSGVVTPNILLLVGNSGSMAVRAHCGGDGPFALVSSPVQCRSAFDKTVAKTGVFNEMSCYTYNTANTRFEPTVPKLLIQDPCPNTDWDGNFLNWVTARRMDLVKKVLIGGQCAVARAVDGTCPPSGTPSKVTLTGQDTFASGTPATVVTTDDRDPAHIPDKPYGVFGGVSQADLVGRIPTTARGNDPNQFLIFTVGSPAPAFFCVFDAVQFPGCNQTDTAFPAPGAQSYAIRVVVPTEPPGTLQAQSNGTVRWGLEQFNASHGGQVLVGVGSLQTKNWATGTWTTSPNNTVAMIQGVQALFPATGAAGNVPPAPLAETLYEGIRYLAQIPPSIPGDTYPMAFSGPAFGGSGPGELGRASEVSALSGVESCPGGYIANACGRDPYFFGSNHSPAWASPSAVVPCCSSFILILSDGEPRGDNQLPGVLQDIAHSVHGTHCSAGDPTKPCVGHKTDYDLSGNHFVDDVALWGHTTDLRQATIPVINEAGHDVPGMQNVTIYVFLANFGNVCTPASPCISGFVRGAVPGAFIACGEGTVLSPTSPCTSGVAVVLGEEPLQLTAKNGAFNDLNGNNLPDLQSEWDVVNNYTGTPGPDGLPDAFFESSTAQDMATRWSAAISSILRRASSGTSVSVLASSSSGEGAVYQAYFFPATAVTIGLATSQVLWTGFTQGLFIDKFGNLREDYGASGCTGSPDGQLILTHDCIIKVRLDTNSTSPTFGQVLIDRFKDDGTAPGSVAGDGIADTTTPFQTVVLMNNGISNVQPMWEGGRRLALLDPGATCESANTWPKSGNMTQSGNTCRRILTWADLSNGNGINANERLEFSTANAFTLCPYLGGRAVAYCTGDNTALITVADISVDPNLTGCLGITRRTCAQNEATGIINFVRGCSVSVCPEQASLRNRTFNVLNDVGATVQKVWKMGDSVYSTPTVVGAPRERFDVIYGDATYAQFFQRYKDRRQVVYIGANDGMLHAFNAGFFQVGNVTGSLAPVQARFTTTPKQPASTTDCSALPCNASVAQYSFRSDAPPLGAELWAFIPQDLLPQLRWATSKNYDHVYYVDLKPVITDARIFTADADHPGGWGTILIGGFRMGGSCTNCTGNKAVPRVVQADFNYNGTITDTGNGTTGSDYRVFLSSYFVMDITNPENEPTLMQVFRDKDLGLTTAAPAVLRTNPLTDAKTSSTGEKWWVIFGTGPTHYDAFSSQNAKFFAVDLKVGPSYAALNQTSGVVTGTTCLLTSPCIAIKFGIGEVGDVTGTDSVFAFDTGQSGAFMADVVTLDFNLDFRVDVIYAGSVICNGTTTSTGCTGTGPVWRGAMWRLTTNTGNTDPRTWGVTSAPTTLISTFAYTTPQATTCTNPSSCKVGPITTTPALTQDDTNSIWLFFGTGRFYTNNDKTNKDIQHFFGVKDCIVNGTCTNQAVERNNLFNSSNVVVCGSCASGTSVSTTGSTTLFTIAFSAGGGSLVNTIQNMDGWFSTFNDPTAPLQTPPRSAMTPGERNLSSPTLIGGTVFLTTFIPTTDLCQISGTGQLYAVFYKTGGPYTGSAIGAVTSGSSTLVSKSISLGQGLPSQMAIQIGAQGTGTSGTTSGSGCAGRITGFIQASTGVLGQVCGTSALSSWSRMMSWRDL